MKIIQYHHSVISADAIGNSIRILHENFQEIGLDSVVACGTGQLQRPAFVTESADTIINSHFGQQLTADDILIAHFSFYDPQIEQLAQLPLKKILVYHNITPGFFFRESGLTDLANACDEGRRQLQRLAPLFNAAVGDSEFNCAELISLGFANSSVIAVLTEMKKFRNKEVDCRFFEEIKCSAEINLLFVGRFVPNKRIERLFAVTSVLKAITSRPIRLHLVGKIWNNEYYFSLQRQASDAGVYENVRFHINASLDQVRTLYSASDVFVTMSDHEGFMVPIVEAFSAACPVIGLNMGAVGETMGGAGLLINLPDPSLVAGLIYILHTDSDLRNRVISAQASRSLAFLPARLTHLWIKKLSTL